MTPADLRVWLTHMAYTHTQAAAALGIARSALAAMLAGERPISRRTDLACAALAAGLDGWRAPA